MLHLTYGLPYTLRLLAMGTIYNNVFHALCCSMEQSHISTVYANTNVMEGEIVSVRKQVVADIETSI